MYNDKNEAIFWNKHVNEIENNFEFGGNWEIEELSLDPNISLDWKNIINSDLKWNLGGENKCLLSSYEK